LFQSSVEVWYKNENDKLKEISGQKSIKLKLVENVFLIKQKFKYIWNI